MYFNLAEEAFLILYHFPLSFCLSSLWTLPAALCILVCIATVLLGLCVLKKGNFYLQRVHKSILKTGLSEAVLSGKNRTIIVITCQRTNLYFFSSPLYSLLSDIFHQSMPASWIKDSFWPQSTVEHPQFFFELKTLGEECTDGWARVT